MSCFSIAKPVVIAVRSESLRLSLTAPLNRAGIPLIRSFQLSCYLMSCAAAQQAQGCIKAARARPCHAGSKSSRGELPLGHRSPLGAESCYDKPAPNASTGASASAKHVARLTACIDGKPASPQLFRTACSRRDRTGIRECPGRQSESVSEGIILRLCSMYTGTHLTPGKELWQPSGKFLTGSQPRQQSRERGHVLQSCIPKNNHHHGTGSLTEKERKNHNRQRDPTSN